MLVVELGYGGCCGEVKSNFDRELVEEMSWRNPSVQMDMSLNWNHNSRLVSKMISL